MFLSLIQTSLHRKRELIVFMEKLNSQIDVDFSELELIFVDQGDNEDVFKILDKRIHLIYIKSEKCSLSCARNKAIPYVTGKYVCFPDDDCWYEPNTLSEAFRILKQGNEGVIGLALDYDGIPLDKYHKDGPITRHNQKGAISFTIFVRFVPDIYFDINIGVGSPYRLSSGEETDYLCYVIDRVGCENILYSNQVRIHHPRNKSDYFKDSIMKTYNYARGWGFLLEKQHFPLKYKIKYFLRPLFGIILYILTLKFQKSYRSFMILKGRIEGALIYHKILSVELK